MAFIAWTRPSPTERETLYALIRGHTGLITIDDMAHISINGTWTVAELRRLVEAMEAIDQRYADTVP